MSELMFRVRQFGGWVLGLFGIIASLLTGWTVLGVWYDGHVDAPKIASYYILGIVTLIIVAFLVRQFQTMRKERYANIAPLIHEAIHCIRDVDTYLIEQYPTTGASKGEYEKYFHSVRVMIGQSLDKISLIFASLTSTHCRTSIKLTYEIEEGIYYYTYARDHGSDQKCRDLDQRRVKQHHDPLDRNVQFSRLFSSDERSWHFFCNNLCARGDFRTTSIKAYEDGYEDRIIPHGFRRLFSKWPLPYRSTMACVIRQGQFDFDQKRGSEVLGFLTVDSESRGVFVERWDVQIMFAMADAMFRPLRRLVKAQRDAEAAGIQIN